MSILNVNTIQPVGSGQTITVSAANISASSTVVTASSFVGNVTGTVNSTGVITATSFSGSGANLTGIAATTNVRTDSLVVSGITTVAAGSTSAPSISPTGDSNTGIFFPSADTIAFAEGGAEAARFNSSGELLVGTVTSTANGGKLQISNGITFPATASACTDVNTLDDYEEGTFTPSFIGSTGSAGSAATLYPLGAYTKIGNTVTFSFALIISNIGSYTGDLRFTGLPFTTTYGEAQPIVVSRAGVTQVDLKMIGAQIKDAGDYINLKTGTNLDSNVQVSDVNTGNYFMLGGSYRI